MGEKGREMKHRHLGAIRFIGELFAIYMILLDSMHTWLERLLAAYKKTKEERWLEFVCELLAAVGPTIDDDAEWCMYYMQNQLKVLKVNNLDQSSRTAKAMGDVVRSTDARRTCRERKGG
jgi:hypothetical protein